MERANSKFKLGGFLENNFVSPLTNPGPPELTVRFSLNDSATYPFHIESDHPRYSFLVVNVVNTTKSVS